ncbi:MAG: tRNA (guanosine(37)-N1)-methyltransferase TrmD [Algisphaera sp.]
MPPASPAEHATPCAQRIDILTLFPEMFPGVLGSSILKRAASHVANPANPDQVRPPVVAYHVHNIRDWSADAKHHRVDSPPYGGGPGMVMQCQPVWDAAQAVAAMGHAASSQNAQHPPPPPRRIFVTPKGKPLTQKMCASFAQTPRLTILCGHYEGLDQRVLDRLRDDAAGGGLEEVSLGDFVLSGGELPALVLIDAIVRLLPGALGHASSAHEDSFSAGANHLLDHPHYTRPATWEGHDVPPVLMNGNHAAIDTWRTKVARELTQERRPDLLGLASTANNAQAPLVVIRDATAATAARTAEQEAILAVHHAAFPADEADAIVKLTTELLDGPDAPISIVAQHGSQHDAPIVGHVLLSIMTHQTEPSCRGLLALGPLAVLPSHQNRGIGRALVREAIRQAQDVRAGRLFVLGDPAFYGPLGFTPALAQGFTTPYDAEGDAVQTLDLGPRRPIPPGHVLWAQPFTHLS